MAGIGPAVDGSEGLPQERLIPEVEGVASQRTPALSADGGWDKLYISLVSIQNFRNFQALDVALGPTSVIVGENKVGKSNLLHALRLVLDPALPDSSRKLRLEDFWDGLPYPPWGHVVRVAVEISDFDTSVDGKAALADCVVAYDPMVARLTYEFRPKPMVPLEEHQISEDDYEFVIYGGVDPKRRVGGEVRQWISLILLPALRDAESELQNWRRSPLRPLLQRLDIDPARLNAVAQSLHQVSQALLQEKVVADLAEAINARIADMAGDALGVDTTLGFGSAKPGQLLRSLQLFVDGDKSRSLSDASLGSANIIFLALLLQNLDEKVQSKEAVTYVLAIEEPEAHLHPHVQRSVFRYFLSRESPVIVTSHSPHLASVTPLEALTLLRDTGTDGTKAFSARSLGLTERQRKDLERYLDVTRAELLFAKGVILVEGAAELFLVPAMAASMLDDDGLPIDLDRYGITVCPVHGTDFSPYDKLLSAEGLDLPSVVITDGDLSDDSPRLPYRGLGRATMLLNGTNAFDAIKNALEAGQWQDARVLLREQSIYVGEKTLELDILPLYSPAFKQSYADLRPRGAGNFNTLVDAAIAGDRSSENKVLDLIDDVGKGRFAQRLADKVRLEAPPEYVEAAIRDIVGRVKGMW